MCQPATCRDMPNPYACTHSHRQTQTRQRHALICMRINTNIPIHICVQNIKNDKAAQIFSTRKACVKTEIQNGRAGGRKPEGGGGGGERHSIYTHSHTRIYRNMPEGGGASVCYAYGGERHRHMLCLHLHASAYFCICYAYGGERQRHSIYTHSNTRIYRNMPMHADMPKSRDLRTK